MRLQDVSKRAPLPTYEQVVPHSELTFTASDVEGTRKCIILSKPKQRHNYSATRLRQSQLQQHHLCQLKLSYSELHVALLPL